MEYSVYITYRCNLRCPFCYVKKRLSLNASTLSDELVEQIIKYISINKSKSRQRDRVMFFGGEPLINYRIIKKFINKSGGLNLLYGMYTNGLLLDSVPLSFLKLLDIILISIDGDKKAHEKYRGQTYKKIMSNIKKIKPKLDSLIISRITVEEETNIYKSVRNLINDTDAIHWQIVNKPKFNNTKKFINNYRENIKELFDFWLFNFKRGKLLNIIPFQAIIASLMFNYPKNNWSFRCGTGSELQTIDVDGNIYYCDEYVGNKKALIGNIYNDDRIDLKYQQHENIFEDCKNCEVSPICRGRCRRCLQEYSVNQIRNYCNLNKYLIEIISKKINEIKNIFSNRKYTLKNFYNIPDCTEEIP